MNVNLLRLVVDCQQRQARDDSLTRIAERLLVVIERDSRIASGEEVRS